MSLSVSQKNNFYASKAGEGQGASATLTTLPSHAEAEYQRPSSTHKPSAHPKPPSSSLERWCCLRLLKAIGDPPISIVLWNGEEISTANQPPVARAIIHDRPTLRRFILDPEFQFGEAYSNNHLEVEGDLCAFLEAVYRSRLQSRASSRFLRNICTWLLHAHRSNSIAASQDNIHRHYDIGNDFYRLWLDKDMIYSCAYFAQPDMTLEEAQRSKLDYVCRKLWLKPGETVIDVGGGWGGLAIHMAKQYGVTVKAFNISRDQNLFARQRARAEGLWSQVEFIDDDYRNITGRFDALVSLGMLEHVGKGCYREFGRIVDRCLAPHGRALIQSIGRSQSGDTNPWIEYRIFPGGHAPTLREMLDIVEPYGFSVLDLENLRLHYAKTLGHWLERFEASAECVEKMFDARFVRMWRLYLSGSWAVFSSGAIQLFQFLFARPTLNSLPWTRSHLFKTVY
ncbi:MAG TPA: cyclopropane-fatty-acyl-phospholipid synthase family protein [Thermoguttaceae bacterium]